MILGVAWYYWVITAGALSSIYNAGLQHYDILWCRWHDCGNKNSVNIETLDEKIDRLLRTEIPTDKVKENYESIPGYKCINR